MQHGLRFRRRNGSGRACQLALTRRPTQIPGDRVAAPSPHACQAARRPGGAPAHAGAALLPQTAAAHAILIASQPPQDGTVPSGTVAIHLQYNSRIDRARSRLTLTRPDRSQATLPIAAEGAPDEMNTAATLTAGAYVLRWQVLAVDGHITRGDVAFTVTVPDAWTC